MIFAQSETIIKSKNNFLNNVQFGGGIGLGIGNGYTNFTIAPSAIYNFNPYVAAGLGIQYSYLKQREIFNSNVYGASIISLINPVEELQLSVELEQLRVNTIFNTLEGNVTRDFWNTALFLGAGYRVENITIGLRYNVLFKENDGVYAEAFMPFMRIYF